MSQTIPNKIVRYRHRITRARRENRPDERGGGILADEMGMGKSLSMLALVTKTLKDGNDWVRHQRETAESPNAPKPSRSTLVVVSSARTCISRESDEA